MRATYQLNNEKLEYNFRLLHEREYDHAQQIQQQKKKINRLQDMLSTLKGKYTKLDKKYKQKTVELTEEYKRFVILRGLSAHTHVCVVCACACVYVYIGPFADYGEYQ